MIHLKRFNESVSEWDLNLVRKFCYENLAYLLDGKTDLLFHHFPSAEIGDNGYYRVIVRNINSKWSDIEVDMCPFLELLEEKYVLKELISNNQIEFLGIAKIGYLKGMEQQQFFSINEIISGCIEPNAEILSMRFFIKL
jgi:hypothetical protein